MFPAILATIFKIRWGDEFNMQPACWAEMPFFLFFFFFPKMTLCNSLICAIFTYSAHSLCFSSSGLQVPFNTVLPSVMLLKPQLCDLRWHQGVATLFDTPISRQNNCRPTQQSSQLERTSPQQLLVHSFQAKRKLSMLLFRKVNRHVTILKKVPRPLHSYSVLYAVKSRMRTPFTPAGWHKSCYHSLSPY